MSPQTQNAPGGKPRALILKTATADSAVINGAICIAYFQGFFKAPDAVLCNEDGENVERSRAPRGH